MNIKAQIEVMHHFSSQRTPKITSKLPEARREACNRRVDPQARQLHHTDLESRCLWDSKGVLKNIFFKSCLSFVLKHYPLLHSQMFAVVFYVGHSAAKQLKKKNREREREREKEKKLHSLRRNHPC